MNYGYFANSGFANHDRIELQWRNMCENAKIRDLQRDLAIRVGRKRICANLDLDSRKLFYNSTYLYMTIALPNSLAFTICTIRRSDFTIRRYC